MGWNDHTSILQFILCLNESFEGSQINIVDLLSALLDDWQASMRVSKRIAQTRIVFDTGDDAITLHGLHIGTGEFDHIGGVVTKGTVDHIIAVNQIYIDIGSEIFVDT